MVVLAGTTAPSSSMQLMDNPTICHTWFLRTLGKAWTVVGQTYSTATRINSSFTFTSGAESTLGVGVSRSGTYGSYSSSGTNSASSDVTIDYPAPKARSSPITRADTHSASSNSTARERAVVAPAI
jgi:hypothetical protein